MGLGRLLHRHSEHADEGGTIDYPRAYELLVSAGFHGRRRLAFTRVAALSGIRRGDRVLDVGCGTGYLTRILSPMAGPTGHVTGVDPAAAMVDYARRHAPDNCTYQVGQGQALDLPDGAFDVVVCSLAVHHMPATGRADAFAQMFRVLRPGGRLMIVEFRPPANHVAAGLMNLIAGPAMRRAPRDLLGTLIPDAGFKVDDDGDLRPMLYYVRATRGSDGAQQAEAGHRIDDFMST